MATIAETARLTLVWSSTGEHWTPLMQAVVERMDLPEVHRSTR